MDNIRNRIVAVASALLVIFTSLTPITINAATSTDISASDITFGDGLTYVYLVRNSSTWLPSIGESLTPEYASFNGNGGVNIRIPTATATYLSGWLLVETKITIQNPYSAFDKDVLTVDIGTDNNNIDITDYSITSGDGFYTLTYVVRFDDFPSLGGTSNIDIDLDILFGPVLAGTTYEAGFVAQLSSEVSSCYLSYIDDLTIGRSKEAGIAKTIAKWGNTIGTVLNGLQNTADLINSYLGLIYERLLGMWNSIIDVLTKIDEFRIQVYDNFTTLFEKMGNEHEEIINGYDSTANNDSLTETETTVNAATEKQDAINNDAFGYVDSYTIPNEGISSYASQFLTVFPLVSSMLQSIYVSSGAFGILFSVIFTMTLVCMVIGMFRFYKS